MRLPSWSVPAASFVLGLLTGLLLGAAGRPALPNNAPPGGADFPGLAVLTVGHDQDLPTAAEFRREGGESATAVYRFTFRLPADAALARDESRMAAMRVYHKSLDR